MANKLALTTRMKIGVEEIVFLSNERKKTQISSRTEFFNISKPPGKPQTDCRTRDMEVTLNSNNVFVYCNYSGTSSYTRFQLLSLFALHIERTNFSFLLSLCFSVQVSSVAQTLRARPFCGI